MTSKRLAQALEKCDISVRRAYDRLLPSQKAALDEDHFRHYLVCRKADLHPETGFIREWIADLKFDPIEPVS